MHSLSCQLMVRISSLSAFSRAAAPLTVIVSQGFAAQAGVFRVRKTYLTRANGWSAGDASRPVRECNSSQKFR